jgi:arylsulfatase A-like enzyme
LPDNTVIGLHGDHGEHLTGFGNPHYDYLVSLRNIFRYKYQIDIQGVELLINMLVGGVFSTDIQDHYLEEAHGHTVYEAATNVPFILHSPDHTNRMVSEQCRQIDVYPTLLDAVGVEYDSGIDGSSLLKDKISPRNAYIRACGPPHVLGQSVMRAVRMDGYKYIDFLNRNRTPELYDLTQESSELSPISKPQIERKMKRELPSEGLREAEDIEIDGLLEDLGYL